jgi:hypothetical protein
VNACAIGFTQIGKAILNLTDAGTLLVFL